MIHRESGVLKTTYEADMALYPLPQVDPRLSAQGQIQYHLLNHSMSLLEFLIGVGYTL